MLKNLFKFLDTKKYFIRYTFNNRVMNESTETECTTKPNNNLSDEEANAFITKHQQKKKNKLEYKAEQRRLLKLRRTQKKETKDVGFNFDDSLKQTDYYFENNLRKVYPYFFYWNTTAKERWFGRTLHEIYQSEFSRAIVNQPLEDLILTGKIQVNGQTKALDYVIRNGDKVSHAKHRHEIPVLGDKIKIIHDGEDYLVVDKPCSIPMHPCGKYRYNSLSIILAKEYRYKNLRTLYRLDRLTSGLCILGKNFQAALVLDKHIKERTAVKTYICRVLGKFPEGRIVVDKPIGCASRKIGLYWLNDENGKESLTEFERVSYNGNTSVVLCYPKTGRTHQIRIHLQYLGHPIINDPLYNQPTVWGEGNGKNGKYEFDKEQIEKNFLSIHTYEAWIIKQEESESTPSTELKKDEDQMIPSNENIQKRKIDDTDNKDVNPDVLINQNNDDNDEEHGNEHKKLKTESEEDKCSSSLEQPVFEPHRIVKDPECFECSQKYRDPTRTDLIMYLHALSYKFGSIEFKTDYPEWSNKDFVE